MAAQAPKPSLGEVMSPPPRDTAYPASLALQSLSGRTLCFSNTRALGTSAMAGLDRQQGLNRCLLGQRMGRCASGTHLEEEAGVGWQSWANRASSFLPFALGHLQLPHFR